MTTTTTTGDLAREDQAANIRGQMSPERSTRSCREARQARSSRPPRPANLVSYSRCNWSHRGQFGLPGSVAGAPRERRSPRDDSCADNKLAETSSPSRSRRRLIGHEEHSSASRRCQCSCCCDCSRYWPAMATHQVPARRSRCGRHSLGAASLPSPRLLLLIASLCLTSSSIFPFRLGAVEAQNSTSSTSSPANVSVADATAQLPVNILCNSRCHCVNLIELQLAASLPSDPKPNASSSSPATSYGHDVAAFSEDYALDEPPDEATQSQQQQQGDQQQQPDVEGDSLDAWLSGGRPNRSHPTYTHTQDSFDLAKLSSHYHGPMAVPFGLDTQQQQRYHQHHRAHTTRKQQHQAMATSTVAPAAANQAATSTGSQQPSGPVSYRLVALRSVDLGARLVANNTGSPNASHPSGQLVELLALQLVEMQKQGTQSLSLASNQLQSEIWTELYALVMYNLRANLYHLDVSRNSLTKLGLAFTGFIEQNLVAANGTWCFQKEGSPTSNNNSTSASTSNQTSHPAPSTRSGAQRAKLGGRQRPVGGLLSSSSGRLYASVHRRMLELLHGSSNGTAQRVVEDDTANAIHTRPHMSAQRGTPVQLEIRALDLSHNKLKWLISDQFKALKLVQTIRLDHNHIRFIHQNAFAGLESLRYLNLNYNRLQVIFVEQFQTNYNMLALMMRSNSVAYLRGGSFASLNNLKRLDLSQNRLTILSNNALVGLESLELLNLSSNQFVQAPSASMHPLTSLRQLDLSDILVSHLAPGTFFHLPVESIWLDSNEQLVGIDRGAFWDLPYLRQLHLNENPRLARINPQAFVGTPALRLIDTRECPSLQDDVRVMLDGVVAKSVSSGQPSTTAAPTAAPTEPSTGANSTTTTIATSIAANNSTGGTNSTPENPNEQEKTVAPHQLGFSKPLDGSLFSVGDPREAHGGAGHVNISSVRFYSYAYYLATLAFLIGALKLVLKYTSRRVYSSDYSLGRRRRVYGIDEAMSMASSSCHNQPHNLSSLSLSSLDTTMAPTASKLDDNHMIELSEQVIPANVSLAVTMSTAAAAAASLVEEQPSVARNEDPEVRSLPDQGNPITRANSFVSLDLNEPTGAHQPFEGHQPAVILDESQQQAPIAAGGCTTLDCPECRPAYSGAPASLDQQRVPDELAAYDMFQRQLYAAGCDYGHAHCDHFYKSLGPAMQLADLVNQMDQFYS